jgi:2,3-bisphosphoglycerate-independent phosphoglycerate mutase
MIDPYTGDPHTQHTNNPVPCLIIDKQKWKLSSDGGLANITPTVLHLMGIDIPGKMHNSLLLEPYSK